jgi:hypothetical protein
MPGEEDLTELSEQVANSSETEQDQLQTGFKDDNGQAERLLTTSKETPQTQQNQAQKLLAGKYKSPQELEKAYLNQNKGYRSLESKQQQLERMIQNPKFQEMAANDPEMRDALAKLGYELMQEETRQDEREGGGRWDGNTNTPDFRMAVLEHKQQLYFDRQDFQQELGRRLSNDEWAALKREIVNAPRLTVRQAWKLTPHFEKELEAKQQKAIEAAGRRPGVTRPRPASQGGIGGPKTPQGKSAINLSEGEKGQFIQDLIDKAGG